MGLNIEKNLAMINKFTLIRRLKMTKQERREKMGQIIHNASIGYEEVLNQIEVLFKPVVNERKIRKLLEDRMNWEVIFLDSLSKEIKELIEYGEVMK